MVKPKDLPEPPDGTVVATFDGEYWDVLVRDDNGTAEGRRVSENVGFPGDPQARWINADNTATWREITSWAERLWILPAQPTATREP